MIHSLKRKCSAAIFCASFIAASSSVLAAYDMENLDRGTVAVAQDGKVFISWRWLGNESDSTAFNIYRNGTLINTSPLVNKTNFVDAQGSASSSYQISAVVNGNELARSTAIAPWDDIALRIPLQRPAGGKTPDNVSYTYSPNDASVADLDGDGQYEIILKWDPSNSKDNSLKGYTGNVFVDAYELDGTQLWRIDLGKNIRAGAHYTQFIAYDFDSDGKAEIAMRTSDASVDGSGSVIGDADADYRNSKGYILTGPEYLTIFDGQTGKALASTDYLPARGKVSSWGDSYGNRVDRFLAGLAWLDGEHPSLIMARGYYTRAVVVAWDWREGKLVKRWTADSSEGLSGLAKQGAHSLSVADVDNDGKHEIIYGGATLDDDGSLMYSTKLGHGDALHVSDLNPDLPGLEVYMVHETPKEYGSYGSEMHNAQTGEIIWGASGEGKDVGRGVTMDIDPNYPGYEAWASRGGLRSSMGAQISSSRPPFINFAVYWDGDLGREMLDKTSVREWDYTNRKAYDLLTAADWNATSNNTTKATPALSADILGDWREEILWRSSDNTELLLFTSTYESDYRFRTLMHDPQYRAAIAWQNVGYNQPPHLSYFLGFNMATPTPPQLNLVGADAVPASVNLTSEINSNSVKLSWDIQNANIRSLEVYRDTDSNPAGRSRLAVLSASTRHYVDTEVEAGQTYYYWIKMTEQDLTVVNSNATAAVVPKSSQTEDAADDSDRNDDAVNSGDDRQSSDTGGTDSSSANDVTSEQNADSGGSSVQEETQSTQQIKIGAGLPILLFVLLVPLTFGRRKAYI